MTVQENLELGAYTTPQYLAEGLNDVYKRFPRLEDRKQQIAGTLGRGTADARHGQSYYIKT